MYCDCMIQYKKLKDTVGIEAVFKIIKKVHFVNLLSIFPGLTRDCLITFVNIMMVSKSSLYMAYLQMGVSDMPFYHNYALLCYHCEVI